MGQGETRGSGCQPCNVGLAGLRVRQMVAGVSDNWLSWSPGLGNGTLAISFPVPCILFPRTPSTSSGQGSEDSSSRVQHTEYDLAKTRSILQDNSALGRHNGWSSHQWPPTLPGSVLYECQPHAPALREGTPLQGSLPVFLLSLCLFHGQLTWRLCFHFVLSTHWLRLPVIPKYLHHMYWESWLVLHRSQYPDKERTLTKPFEDRQGRLCPTKSSPCCKSNSVLLQTQQRGRHWNQEDSPSQSLSCCQTRPFAYFPVS